MQVSSIFRKFALIASITVGFTLSSTRLHAADTFGNGTIITPATASGGTGTVADLQSDNDVNYTVAKSGSMTVGGFGGHAGAINSVYVFAQYSVESGYSGTNALQINGVNTTIVPVDRDYGRWGYTEITGGSFGIDTSAEIESLSVTFINNDTGGGDSVFFDCIYIVVNPTSPIPIHPTWLEDFNGTGQAEPMVWEYEVGYKRNNEAQYYQAGTSNGWQEGGNFVIEGRKEVVSGYQYTSASIRTNNKYYWKHGRAQIRAQIPAKAGMWPAIWGTGETGQWPHNGEVDIMEYYQNKILANCAVGTAQQWTAKWDGSNRTMTSLTAVEPNWRTQWHIWTMQWDDQNVRLYCDNILMNTIPQTWLKNSDGYNTSWGPQYPFITNGMSCWLNLAIGGNAGGDPTATMNSGPQRYLIDYWKIWEGATDNVAPTDILLDSNLVAEGSAAGTVVGNLSALDADPAEVLKYQLVAGTGDTHNSQFVIPEFVSDNTLLGVLKTAAVLNYADGPTRSIRVRVTDIEGATYIKVLTVQVTSVSKYVTYDGNGSTSGSVPTDSTAYASGATVTVLDNTGGLARTGDNFTGWNTAADGNGIAYSPGNTFTITDNVTLYAQWTSAPTYTVAYDGNGHTAGTAPVNQTKIQGVDLTLAGQGDLTRTGYAFSGWNTASGGTGTDYAAGATYSADAAVTLHAKWTELPTYTVSYSGNGHTGGTVPGDQTKTQGVDLTLASNSGNLVRTGYTFVGWNSQADGLGTDYDEGATYIADADLTLHAKWNAVPVVDAGPDQVVHLTGESVQWTPADTTTVAWYDANDYSKITESSGAVSQWNDKSGNAYHMKQGTATAMPVYTAADSMFGGRPSISTGPSYKYLTMDQSVAMKRIYVVCYYGDGTQTAWTTHNALVGSPDGSVRLTGRSGGNKVFDGNAATQNFDYNGATYRNGSTVNTNGQVSGLPITGEIFTVTAASARTAQWRLLGNNANYTLWDGGVGEVIFTDGAESLAVQQNIEGYLAHKWGVSARLSADHPHYSAAPLKSVASATATLSGQVTDPDDLPASVWSDTGTGTGTGTVTFSDQTALNPNVTFSAVGTYVLRLTANDGSTQTISEVTITVNPAPPAGYVTWSEGVFANAFTLRSVDQNPDGDILNNFLEFAFGTDPTLNDSSEIAVDGSVNGPPRIIDAGGGVMEFYFMRRVDHGSAGSINYTAQFSSDLGTFYNNEVTPSFVATSSANPAYELVKLTYPASLPNLQQARFGRVMVEPVP